MAIAVVIGLAVALLAGLVSVRAGVSGVVIAQDQIIGVTHLGAGAISQLTVPDLPHTFPPLRLETSSPTTD
jgi:hypothetical protein